MRPAAIVFLLIFATARVGAEEFLIDCNSQVVQYSDPEIVPLAGHVSVRPLPQRPAALLDEKDPEFKPKSPQGTAAFNRVVTADTTKPDPRSNSIDVFTTKGDRIAWRIDLVDLMDNARLSWINEDLLFVQAWWGRIVSTDLIFQVSSGRFIYAKEANYGLLIQPCEGPDARKPIGVK